jgi:hypothetical protein
MEQVNLLKIINDKLRIGETLRIDEAQTLIIFLDSLIEETPEDPWKPFRDMMTTRIKELKDEDHPTASRSDEQRNGKVAMANEVLLLAEAQD